MGKRVVITGMGMVTSLGMNIKENWDNLIAGKSGVDYLKNIPEIDQVDVKIGAQVKNYDGSAYFNPRDIRQYDLYTQFALIAAKEAITQSGLFDSDIDKNRVGTIVSSGIGGLNSLLSAYKAFIENGQKDINLYTIPKMISNIAAGIIALNYGLHGVSFSIVSACTSSLHAIGEAFRKIQYSEIDAAIAGGSEASICGFSLGAFSNLKALSKNNDNPQKASCPFNKTRDGFVMGEGAGIVVLEEYEHAKKRGAQIFGEIIGYGASSDAHHLTAPHPDGLGAKLSIENALIDAKIDRNLVGYVNAHGTSTPVGDVAETKALKETFGKHAYNLLISSNKSMVGHLLGGAGVVEGIFTALTLKEGIVPPTINLNEPDPELDLNYVPNKAIEKKLDYAISNSFGFGGQNGTVVFKKA